MTDRPIIFSAPMVRALLDGTKTQTRRAVSPKRQTSCPYGLPGDRLWVREACMLTTNRPPLYRADVKADLSWQPVWKPSLHMPRWASRLTLIVTDVRAERLQDISEEDARAEGATMRPKCNGHMGHRDGWSMDWSEIGKPSRFADRGVLRERDISLCDPQAAFASYWNSINGPDAWDDNPWVWAVSFEVQQRNIDEVAA